VIFVADAHRNDGKRFVVRAEEKLTAFVELEYRRFAPSIHKSKSSLHFGQRVGSSKLVRRCVLSILVEALNFREKILLATGYLAITNSLDVPLWKSSRTIIRGRLFVARTS
jgi:hypothetical protein